jgi:hypothetical protein
VSSSPTYQSHITSSDDLVTPYDATRAGFVALALEKNRKATPFVAEARALKVAASQAKTPKALVSLVVIRQLKRLCNPQKITTEVNMEFWLLVGGAVSYH